LTITKHVFEVLRPSDLNVGLVSSYDYTHIECITRENKVKGSKAFKHSLRIRVKIRRYNKVSSDTSLT